MSELDDLYQAIILDHDRAPRNYGRLEAPSGAAEGYNPLCGDRLTVTVQVSDGRLAEVRFEASSCAIARASGSLMTLALCGQSLADARRLGQAFEALLRGPPGQPAAELGELRALAGVRNFPGRIRCAMLAWQTLLEALP